MRRERILAVIGAALLAVGAYLVCAAHGGSHYFLLNAGSEFPAVPMVVLEPTAPRLPGSVVVIHGLGANLVVMLTLGQRLAVAGLRVFLFDGPGHGNNTTSFSFAGSISCAAAVLDALSRRGDINLNRTVLLGHSLGGSIAILTSNRFNVAGTIAVAPAPVPLQRGIPPNLLVISPQFDVPVIQGMERTLRELGGETRDSPAEFAERRAFREITLNGRSHTSTIFDPTATMETARWAAAALGTSLPAGYTIPWGGLAGGVLGFWGLCCMFPWVASSFACAWRVRPALEQSTAERSMVALVYWTFSALLGVGVLMFWLPFERLHLYSGDYLASLAAIASVPLLTFLAPQWLRRAKTPNNTMGMAVTFGFLTFLAFGA